MDFRVKTAEYTLAAILIGVVMVAAAAIAAYAEDAPIMVITTDSYLSALNDRETEAGIAPDESLASTSQGEELPQGEVVDNAYLTIPISDSEFNELRWVVALEAQGEGFVGECAVVESIFNRVLSDKWPGTVHEVLAQRGQYSTYRYIGSGKAWATPSELEDDAISEVLRMGPSILPDMSYVYFDTRGRNGKRRVKLGRHFFGAE